MDENDENFARVMQRVHDGLAHNQEMGAIEAAAVRRARRDRFAAAALTGLLADPNLDCAPELIAKGAVNNADALIAELDRTEPK